MRLHAAQLLGVLLFPALMHIIYNIDQLEKKIKKNKKNLIVCVGNNITVSPFTIARLVFKSSGAHDLHVHTALQLLFFLFKDNCHV